jgi:hypothetical protein
MEGKPDRWYRKTYREKVKESVKQLSEYINAEESGLVLVENASTGVNRFSPLLSLPPSSLFPPFFAILSIPSLL